jgi:uncharacterized membrane protein
MITINDDLFWILMIVLFLIFSAINQFIWIFIYYILEKTKEENTDETETKEAKK